MTSGAETVDLTLTGRGGGDASPHEFFSELAAEALGESG